MRGFFDEKLFFPSFWLVSNRLKSAGNVVLKVGFGRLLGRLLAGVFAAKGREERRGRRVVGGEARRDELGKWSVQRQQDKRSFWPLVASTSSLAAPTPEHTSTPPPV